MGPCQVVETIRPKDTWRSFGTFWNILGIPPFWNVLKRFVGMVWNFLFTFLFTFWLLFVYFLFTFWLPFDYFGLLFVNLLFNFCLLFLFTFLSHLKSFETFRNRLKCLKNCCLHKVYLKKQTIRTAETSTRLKIFQV